MLLIVAMALRPQEVIQALAAQWPLAVVPSHF